MTDERRGPYTSRTWVRLLALLVAVLGLLVVTVAAIGLVGAPLVREPGPDEVDVP